ncbi:MAG TPA: hypothetical protein VMS02_03485, partial [Solirubrobacteraceae bacterium]|nr:hypothetical protein [Solirubrobacteraceae bacterium]
MSSDATTLPLQGEHEPSRRLWIASRGAARRPRAGSHEVQRATARQATIAAVALATLVLCTAIVVLVAANRPSFLSAPSHVGFFPHWLAGPFGGVWPSFTRNPQVLKSLLTGALVLMYLAYLAGLRYVPLLRRRWVIATLIATHVLLVLAPPLSLTDVFNYINYGRMGVVDHLNPYVTIPALEPHTDPSFDLSNWHGLLSPYGPLFTLLTYAIVPLGVAGSLWTLKVLMAACSLGIVLLVWKCARLLGREPVQAIVLVGLNPLVLLWGLGGVHNDFLTVLCIVLAFYLLLRDGPQDVATGEASAEQSASPGVRGLLTPLAPLEIGAGVALAAATSLKASAGIVILAVLGGLLHAPRRLGQVLLGLAAGAVVLGACSLLAFGPHLPDLGTQGRLVIGTSLPNLLGLALGQGGETETMQTLFSALLVALVLGCAWLAWRWRDSLTASGWATLALLLT